LPYQAEEETPGWKLRHELRNRFADGLGTADVGGLVVSGQSSAGRVAGWDRPCGSALARDQPARHDPRATVRRFPAAVPA